MNRDAVVVTIVERIPVRKVLWTSHVNRVTELSHRFGRPLSETLTKWAAGNGYSQFMAKLAQKFEFNLDYVVLKDGGSPKFSMKVMTPVGPKRVDLEEGCERRTKDRMDGSEEPDDTWVYPVVITVSRR